MNYICKAPKYGNIDGTAIDLIWEHPQFGEIPFLATSFDSEKHGRDIYALAKAGEYGEIAPYDGPSAEDAAAEQVRSERDQLLAASDVYVLPDRWAAMTPEQQTLWSNYRQALRDIPLQEGFPLDVSWPVKPAQ